MKDLTCIPNARYALLYKEILVSALEKAGISVQQDIDVDWDGQSSDCTLMVSDKNYVKAKEIMQAVIKAGPPK